MQCRVGWAPRSAAEKPQHFPGNSFFPREDAKTFSQIRHFTLMEDGEDHIDPELGAQSNLEKDSERRQDDGGNDS